MALNKNPKTDLYSETNESVVLVFFQNLRFLHPFCCAAGSLLFPCHTGVSGPAALKLSAFGARVLNEGGYRGKLVVNWLAGNNPSKVRARRTYVTAVHAQTDL